MILYLSITQEKQIIDLLLEYNTNPYLNKILQYYI